MRSGTSVPGPRTSITSGPFCTESIQIDARSTRGAAGLRPRRPSVMATSATKAMAP